MDTISRIVRPDVACHDPADRVTDPCAALNVNTADLFADLHGDLDSGVPCGRGIISRRLSSYFIPTDVSPRVSIGVNYVPPGFKPVDAIYAAVIRSLRLGKSRPFMPVQIPYALSGHGP